ncbi:MAG: T9SS type A sorting domain-containing protein, partial [Bacteroidales bacterium]|nr:T9SS type A sorting domain-containing protein [Bacteroidales bacterium]
VSTCSYVSPGNFNYYLSFKSLANCLFTANAFVDTLNYGDVIHESSHNWAFSVKKFCMRNEEDNIREGTWVEGKDYFVGLRMTFGPNRHFGWVRGEIIEAGEGKGFCLIIKDLAYNATPYAPIFAGEGMPNRAMNLMANDQSNFKDGRDIKYSFDKAFHEELISEYRLFVVNTDLPGLFNLDAANNVEISNCLTINTGFEDYTGNLTPTSTTTTGELIQDLQRYLVYVLAVDVSGISDSNKLSLPSEEIMLVHQTEHVSKPKLVDIDNYGDSRDLVVHFEMAFNESNIKEYRIMLLTEENAEIFNMEDANSLSDDHYLAIQPQSGNYSVSLSDLKIDVLGNTITNGGKYCAIIQSVCDGIHTDFDNISDHSNLITLSLPNNLWAGQKVHEAIHYSDFVPDLNVEINCSFQIDVDDDGINDLIVRNYYFEHNATLIREHSIEMLNGWEFAGNEENHAYKLEIYDQVSNDLTWKEGEALLCRFNNNVGCIPINGGYWTDFQEGYLGLRLVKEKEETIYAWVRIAASGTRIMDKGFLLHPERFRDDNVQIYPNPVKDKVFINLSNDEVNHHLDISIFNSMGQMLVRKPALLYNYGTYLLNFEDVPGTDGLYFIRVENDENRTIRKIIRVK